MFDSIFNDVNLLQKGLSASWLRQEVTMNNIANSDTPNFKSSHVEFEDSLKSALSGSDFDNKKTRANHRDFGDDATSARVVQDDNLSWREDGNNVDIESQMTELARNSIYYTALTNKVTGQLSRLRTAIVEGGK